MPATQMTRADQDDPRRSPAVDPAVVREPAGHHRGHVAHERRAPPRPRARRGRRSGRSRSRSSRRSAGGCTGSRAGRSARGSAAATGVTAAGAAGRRRPRRLRASATSGGRKRPETATTADRDDDPHGAEVRRDGDARRTRRGRRARPPRARPRPTSRGAPAGSTGRTRAGRRRRACSATRPSTASNTPSTRNASASAGHDGARPIATTASAAATPATAPTRPLPKRAISTPANPPASRPPIGSAAIAAPSSALVRPSPSRISGSRGRYGRDEHAAREEQRADGDAGRSGARGADGGDHRPPMVPEFPRRARGACPIVSTMPELPEVETVARDLRRRLLPSDGGAGPAITGARVSWQRTLRDEDPARFVGGRHGPAGRGDRAARQAADRRPLRRRVPDGPPQDDRPAVRRAGVAAAGPVRAARAVARRRTRAALPRHPQVRPGRAVRRRRRPVRRRRARAPGPAVHAARVPQAHPGPPRRASSRSSSTRRSSPGWATSTPTRRCGGRSCTRCARRAPCARPTSGACTGTSSRCSPRPSSAAARSIDDYTAPDGDGEMQEHLDVYQRTGQPCHRCGRPIRRIVIGIRATHFCSWCQRLPRRSDRAGAAPLLRTMTPRPGRAAGRADRPPMGRARRRGRARAGRTDEAERARGRAARTAAAAATRPRGRPDAAPGRRVSLAAPRGRGPRDRDVRHPRRRHRRRSRPASASASSGPNGAGKTTLLRIASRAATSRTAGSRRASAACSLGLLGQEAHFDEAFMAAPDLRSAVRHGAAHLERMAEELGRLEHDGHAGGDRLRRPPAPVRHPRRLHARPARGRGAVGPGLRARRVGAAADGDLRRPADPRGARPARDRRPGPAAARRADQPPRHRRDRVARGAPAPPGRGAPRRLPRPRVPRRDRVAGVGAARPPADRVPRRLHRLPPPARRARRAGRARGRSRTTTRSRARSSSSSATAASAST